MSAFQKSVFVLLSLGAALSACPPNNGNTDGGSDAGACSTFATEHERLLNATTTATKVQKTPSIPEGAFP